MDESGARRAKRIDVDIKTVVRAIHRRHLDTFSASGTCDEDCFTVFEAMKPLESVNTTQRNPLPGTTVVTGIDHV